MHMYIENTHSFSSPLLQQEKMNETLLASKKERELGNSFYKSLGNDNSFKMLWVKEA